MTAFPAAPEPGVRAAPLWTASTTVLALMPVGMVIAHRSSPVFLVVSTLLALIGVAVEGRPAAWLEHLRAAAMAPLGLAVLAFLAWSVASLGWSGAPSLSLHALGEFWLPVVSAALLALILPERMPRWGLPLFAGMLALACALILADLATGLVWRRAVGLRWQTFIFNRPVLTCLVGLAPVLAFMAPRGGKAVAVGLGLLALVWGTILRSDSGAAELGILVAALTATAAFIAPRLTLAGAVVAVILVFATAPWHGAIGNRLIPAQVHAELADSHSRDRIDIWTSFGSAIRAQPVLGGGFGVSPAMRDTPVAGQVPPAERTLLAVGHPHNAAVQVWAELGAVGALLAALILLLALRSLSRLPALALAPSLALMAAAAAVSIVGHGAWQGWWPAAIGAAIVWLRSAQPREAPR